MNKKKIDAVCEICGKVWKTNNPSRFCSQECVIEYRYTTFIKKWFSGEEDGARGSDGLSNYVKRWVFEKANNECEKCGFSKTHPRTGSSILEIHHIDEDPSNNRPENLILLCPNCHALSDSRDTRKGNGRRYNRSQYYKNKQGD